jgi:hypothetical protein
VKDDNRELANGFGQFLTCNMHMNRYLELVTSLKQQTNSLLDTFVYVFRRQNHDNCFNLPL